MTSDIPTEHCPVPPPDNAPMPESTLWVERHAEVKRLDVWWKEWLEAEVERMTISENNV